MKRSLISINLQNITKSFGKKLVFKDLSFDFESGKLYALIGKNGSGKSTLLRIMALLEPLSSGKISFLENNRLAPFEKYRTCLSYFSPLTNLYPKLTVQENLNFFLTLRHKSLTREQLEVILSRVGLFLKPDDYSLLVENLSTGQKERLKLALLIALDARIWLLDEVCSHLDVKGKALFYQLLKIAKKEGKLIVWTTNDKKEALLCDEILSLNR